MLEKGGRVKLASRRPGAARGSEGHTSCLPRGGQLPYCHVAPQSSKAPCGTPLRVASVVLASPACMPQVRPTGCAGTDGRGPAAHPGGCQAPPPTGIHHVCVLEFEFPRGHALVTHANCKTVNLLMLPSVWLRRRQRSATSRQRRSNRPPADHCKCPLRPVACARVL
jgi:hypothetical protein